MMKALDMAFNSAVAEIAVADMGGADLDAKTQAIADSLSSAFLQTIGSVNTRFINEIIQLVGMLAQVDMNEVGGGSTSAAAGGSAYATSGGSAYATSSGPSYATSGGSFYTTSGGPAYATSGGPAYATADSVAGPAAGSNYVQGGSYSQNFGQSATSVSTVSTSGIAQGSYSQTYGAGAVGGSGAGYATGAGAGAGAGAVAGSGAGYGAGYGSGAGSDFKELRISWTLLFSLFCFIVSTECNQSNNKRAYADNSIDAYFSERTCWWNEVCKREFQVKFRCRCPRWSFCRSPGRYFDALLHNNKNGLHLVAA